MMTLIEALIAEYKEADIYPLLSGQQRGSMKDAIRGIAVKMNVYDEFCEALDNEP